MTFYELLRQEFEEEIKTKTGWGKNEIMSAFDKACARALYKWAQLQGVPIV